MAGVIDSDGCIGVKPAGAGWSPRVTVKQVEPHAVDLFAAEFGGYRSTDRPTTPRGRPLEAWHVQGQQAAAVLRRLLPWLRIKRAQAENALAVAEMNKRISGGRSFPVRKVIRGEALLPAGDAAVLAGYHRGTGNQACRKGSVPCVKRNGRWFIPEAFVAEWRDRPDHPPRDPEIVAELQERYEMAKRLNRVGRR